MTSNLLTIKCIWPVAFDLATELKHLVSTQFRADPERFINDYERLQRLREDTDFQSGVSEESLEAVKHYYAQITFVSGKLPLDSGIQWSWKVDDHVIVTQDILIERAATLYNIATVYAQLGLQQDRSTKEGIKSSNVHFQQASGVYDHLALLLQESPQDTVEIFSPVHIQFLKSLMLAQAQECIWQKAVLDQLKDKLISQLSQQVGVFYAEALKNLQRSPAIASVTIHHLEVKYCHFAAAAQFRASLVALAASQYGVEVARLRNALELCSRAQRHSAFVDKQVAADLSGLTERVKRTLLQAERDNDMIYLIKVPSATSLLPISPALMVKGLVPEDIAHPTATPPRDQFCLSDLVPYIISNVADLYAHQKQDVFRDVESAYQALEVDMQNLLSHLGLPGAVEVCETDQVLPQLVLEQAEEVRASGGTVHLYRLLDQLTELATSTTALVEEILEDIQDYITELDNKEFANSRAQIIDYQSLLYKASESDALVRQKVTQWAERVDPLCLDPKLLVQRLPSNSIVSRSSEAQNKARVVRNLLAEWTSMFTVRKHTLNVLESKLSQDSLDSELIEHASRLEMINPGVILHITDFETLVDRRIEELKQGMISALEEAERQDGLKARIKAAKEAYDKSMLGSEPSAREIFLQDLSTAYHKYREIAHNLDEGAKFYIDLHQAIYRLKDDIERRYHANKAISVTSLSTATGSMKLDSRNTEICASSSPRPGLWSTNAGIKFNESTTTSMPKSYAFDPRKHNIVFAEKKI